MKNPKLAVGIIAAVFIFGLAVAALWNPESDARELLGFAGTLLLAVIIYFAPSAAASSNQHPNATAIMVLNLFGGWTVIGWIVALVWAYTKKT